MASKDKKVMQVKKKYDLGTCQTTGCEEDAMYRDRQKGKTVSVCEEHVKSPRDISEV